MLSSCPLGLPVPCHSPPCKPSKYHGELAGVWAVPFLLIILTVVGMLLTCVSFCRSTRSGSLASGGVYISVNSSFLERSREGPLACAALIGFVALLGMTISLVASDQVHTLILNAMQIFRANYAAYDSALASAAAGIASAGPSNSSLAASVLAQANSAASVYRDNSTYFIGNFSTLDALRQTLMILTAVLVALATIGGVVAIALKWNRLVNGIIFVCFLALVLVFVNMLIYTLAANVISDMCVTINGCHFCYDVNNATVCGASVACNTPWFTAMSSCPASAQSRFAPITSFVNSDMDGAAQAVCSAIDSLCAQPGLSCYHSHECSAHVLRKHGLSTTVCSGTPVSCSTVAGLNTTAEANLASAVANVQAAMATFGIWASAHDDLSSMNCAANNAFIESVPLGTYNLLQQLLCPRVMNPANPPQSTFSLMTIGLIIAGLALPIVIAVLLSTKSKPRYGGPTERTSLLSR